jgi:hypothetical protein
MANDTINLPVCHRVGWVGKAAIGLAALSSRLGLELPLNTLVWAINHSSYVKVGEGPWKRMKLDLKVEEF